MSGMAVSCIARLGFRFSSVPQSCPSYVFMVAKNYKPAVPVKQTLRREDGSPNLKWSISIVLHFLFGSAADLLPSWHSMDSLYWQDMFGSYIKKTIMAGI